MSKGWYEFSFFLGPCTPEQAAAIGLAIGQLGVSVTGHPVYVDELRVIPAPTRRFHGEPLYHPDWETGPLSSSECEEASPLEPSSS